MTGLAYKLVDAPWFNRRVGIIRKADRSLQPVAQRFIETMHSMPDLRTDESFKSVRRLDKVPARTSGPGGGRSDGLLASVP